MDFVGKALWYVETNFEDEFSLDEVATVAGVSKFHLVRAFRTCEPRRVCRRPPNVWPLLTTVFWMWRFSLVTIPTRHSRGRSKHSSVSRQTRSKEPVQPMPSNLWSLLE